MSWSLSASGTAAAVKDAVSKWKSEIEANDRNYDGVPEKVIELHGAQVQKAVDSANAFADAAPEGYAVGVSANGHAGVSGDSVTADQWNVSLSGFMPAPVPTT